MCRMSQDPAEDSFDVPVSPAVQRDQSWLGPGAARQSSQSPIPVYPELMPSVIERDGVEGGEPQGATRHESFEKGILACVYKFCLCVLR